MSDAIPTDGFDIDGADLAALVAGYVHACRTGDVVWAIRALTELQEVVQEHFEARLDEARVLGKTWTDIGALFGLTGREAWSLMTPLTGAGPNPE